MCNQKEKKEKKKGMICMKQNLSLHQPVEITYEDWYCSRTIVASAYDICGAHLMP